MRETAVMSKQEKGALERVREGITVSMNPRKGKRRRIIPQLSHASEAWMWKAAQQSWIYMLSACGVA